MLIPIIFLLVLQLLPCSNAYASTVNETRGKCGMIGVHAVLDSSSRTGKEQKIAMEIAVQDFNRFKCSKLLLIFHDSLGDSARTLAIATNLKHSKQVHAIIGTITHDEAIAASGIYNAMKNIPILSLASPAVRTESPTIRLPYFIQVGTDVAIQIRCMAAIVGELGMRKVTAIYEHINNGYGFSSDQWILTLLSYSLRLVGSEIDDHLALPSLSSQSNPEVSVEKELSRLKISNSNRVFLIVQSSLEMATLVFKKAKQMGMMEQGWLWVIPDEVASLVGSMDSSAIFNMQGVIGVKSDFLENSETIRKFKYEFRRKFASEYPQEENINPSIFALRSYDATWAIAQAAKESRGKFSQEEFSERIAACNFEGLSGKISHKNGKMLPSRSFNIINVIGKSYKDLVSWSPEFGFSKNLARHQLMDMVINNGSIGTRVSSALHGPGGYSNEMKIGVPAKGAFTQFVKVTYDETQQETSITGFSIDVFKAAVKRLPYHLSYEFVPFDGSYDEMVEQVHDKKLDAAVGDIEIMAYRSQYVMFSQTYIESGLDMVVATKPNKSKEIWMFTRAFTIEMWLMMAAMHIFIGIFIWLMERKVNEELRGFGAMLWFLVTVLFYAHRESIRHPSARIVLGPWLFVIFIVTTSFTSNFTSMMTMKQLEPSVLDIETLRRTNAPIGCNGNSFIVKYLVEVLKFKPQNIKRINSMDDYHTAFKNRDIEAAFFASPHAKVFLAKYSCTGYVKAGNTIRLGGFGFVFPKCSPLGGDISESLLKVIESGETHELEKDMISTISCSSSKSKTQQEDSSLGVEPFLGLFGISATIAVITWLCSIKGFVMCNLRNLMTHVQEAFTQFTVIWSWIKALFIFRDYNLVLLLLYLIQRIQRNGRGLALMPPHLN